MSYEDSVFDIQRKLYKISQTDPDVIRVNPDGIYGEETEKSVRSFQKKNYIRQSGKVDLVTWQRLGEEAKRSETILSEPQGIAPFVGGLKGGRISVGDRFDAVILVKMILHTLSLDHDYLGQVVIDDSYDEETAEKIKMFQSVHGMIPSGEIDILTWNALADGYRRSDYRDGRSQ